MIKHFKLFLVVVVVAGLSVMGVAFAEDSTLTKLDLFKILGSNIVPRSSNWIVGNTTTKANFQIVTSTNFCFEGDGCIVSTTLNNYLYLPGRTGGQTVYGSTASSTGLQLWGNTTASTSPVLVNTNVSVTTNSVFSIGSGVNSSDIDFIPHSTGLGGWLWKYGSSFFEQEDSVAGSADRLIIAGNGDRAEWLNEGRDKFLMSINGENSGIPNRIYMLKGVAIGSQATVYPSVVPPTNGLYVEGNVGLGTSNPTQKLDIYNGNIALTPISAPTAPTVALAGLGAGNVNAGSHQYFITFVVGSSETSAGTLSSAVTVISTSTNGQVALTNIPVGVLGNGVTARKIYRSKANDPTNTYFLATISNNTATTYTDNTADSGLIDTAYEQKATLRENNVGPWIYRGANKAGLLGLYNTFFGRDSGNAINQGYLNTGVGVSVLSSLTSGSYNAAIGTNAGLNLSTGVHNMLMGTYAGYNLTGGSYNVGVGTFAVANAMNSQGNTAIGMSAGRYIGSGGTAKNYNTMIGFTSGYYPGNNINNASVDDENSTYIGAYSGNASTTPLTNANAFGYYATVMASNTMIFGGTGANAVRVGISTTTANAWLHLPAGLATTGFSPLKFTLGTLLTTPESGAVEWNGTDLFLTNSSSTPQRYPLVQGIFGGMRGDNVNILVDIISTLTYTKVGAGLFDNSSQGFTFSNSTLIAKESGKYIVNWDMSVATVAGNEEIEGELMVNNTATDTGGSSHTQIQNVNIPRPIGSTGILTLNAGDIVSMSLKNRTGNGDITVNHGNLTLFRISN